MAVVNNKQANSKLAINNSTKALSIDSNAVKALFQRSVAHLKVQDFESAATDCKFAIVINPKEKSYRDHWELIKTEKANAAKTEQAAMQKFFS
jgi:tetratricopeptide (TPR) repeat protein